MTITRQDVIDYGYDLLAETISNLDDISITLHTNISEELDSLVEDKGYESSYEVNYYHEAYDIVTSSEFDTNETPDFTGCTNALECIMREAIMSVEGITYEGWYTALDEIKEAANELVNKALEEGYEDIKVSFSNSSVYGWAAHNYETESGLCVWEALEDECFALEISVAGVVISCCINHSEKVN